MNVFTRTIWSCAAQGCNEGHVERGVMSVYAAMDPRTVMPRPCLPEGWNVVEGNAYCGRHTVEVIAIVRTPTLINIDCRTGRVFIGGQLEEEKRLRIAA